MKNQVIEYIERTLIRPYGKNAKKHPAKQVNQIAESIRQFGFLVPIVIDENNVIIAGHGRYEASFELKIEKIPCIRATHLTEEQVKAYRLADNKLNESEWDMDLVITELKELSVPMLEITGFSQDLIIGDEDLDDVIPEAPKEPRSKLGDVYQLGEHTLVVGDSTKPETFKTLSGGGHLCGYGIHRSAVQC